LRRTRIALLAASILCAATATAQLQQPSRRIDDLLLEAPAPPVLRASLAELVTGAAGSDSVTAARAEFHIASSYQRGGMADSAIVHYARAAELHGDVSYIDALIDALLLRQAAGDADRAVSILVPRLARGRLASEWNLPDTEARLAWAMFLKGDTDSAAHMLERGQRRLLDPINPFHREWRYRMGVVALESNDPRRAYELLLPLAVGSRMQDHDVMEVLRDALRRTGAAADRLEPTVLRDLAPLDAEEDEVLASLGGGRASFVADDGFPLSAVVFAPRPPARRRAIVGLVGHDETFESWDSLAVGLSRAGYAVILMDVRGANRSVARTSPVPESWRGREVALQTRVARDVPHALRALARTARVDTTRYLVAGAGPTAAIAVEAATLDRRARLLMLMSPNPAPVERGVMRARLGTLARPVFIQLAPEEHHVQEIADALYRVVDPRASRIADSEQAGRGPRIFRRDPRVLPRFRQWLDESWPKSAVRRSPRPAGPRPG
jgi:hypothetical protein